MEQARTSTPPEKAGRRAYSRLRVRLAARLVTLDRTVCAVLTDLSIGGARLSLPAPVASGQDAILQWDHYEAFGTVCWSNANLCGLKFLDPVAPRVLIATRDLHDASGLPDETEMTRACARGWVNGNFNL